MPGLHDETQECPPIAIGATPTPCPPPGPRYCAVPHKNIFRFFLTCYRPPKPGETTWPRSLGFMPTFMRSVVGLLLALESVCASLELTAHLLLMTFASLR